MSNSFFYWSGFIFWCTTIFLLIVLPLTLVLAGLLIGVVRKCWYTIKHLLPPFQWTEERYCKAIENLMKDGTIKRKKNLCIYTDNSTKRLWWQAKNYYILIKRKK